MSQMATKSKSRPSHRVSRPGIAQRPSPPGPRPSCWVGECTELGGERRPGRVRVCQPMGAGRAAERWLPTLLGLAIRERDRLLVQEVENGEPVVVGVVDGLARRPEVERVGGPSLAMQPDESVRVAAVDGTPLLEVFQTRQGPTVRLLDADVKIELPGRLDLEARSVSLKASHGAVEIEANDDVIVVGETIKLN